MLQLVALHAVLALCAPVLLKRVGRRGFLVLALGPAAAAAFAFLRAGDIERGAFPTSSVSWVEQLGLTLNFRIDALSWLLLVVAGTIGALVMVYCSRYFSKGAAGLGRFAAVLTAFSGAMVGLVTTDNLLVMFVFWELTSVFSYLLIGHQHGSTAPRRAAMQALIVTTAGGLTMLVGLVILGVDAGTFTISQIVANPPSGPAITAAAICLAIGAATKSAQVPSHFWLPGAMCAPTPVSAYLHAAAMVKAGIYVIARFAPAFALLAPWRWLVLCLGATTVLLGGYRALRQHDLKLVLAFGTVSQLGLLVLLLGYGTRGAALAGLTLLAAHALFKAALFLVVGAIDAAAGTRDLRRLGGLARAMPAVAFAGFAGFASMIGLIPFAGCLAKEAALESLLHDSDPASHAVLAVLILGSVLTVAYGLRFAWGAFGPAHDGAEAIPPIKRPAALLSLPPLILALAGLAAAIVPGQLERMVGPFAATYPAGSPGHLTLWGGFTPALAITAGVLALGAFAFWQRVRLEAWQGRRRSPRGADQRYRRLMRRIDEFAADLTGATQRGSLPFYLSLILLVFVVGPGLALAVGLIGDQGRFGPLRFVPWDSPAQGAIVAVVVAAAILASRARRRLKAVLLVGATGYGCAALFVVHGAPDLALTQVLTETVTLVVFVLVLRRLPAHFSNRPLRASRFVRAAIGALAGVAMMLLVTAAPLARVHPSIADAFPAFAYDEGGGRNVVNVTLVDLRAWDTVGEISVLVVAATGVASLVFISRRTAAMHRLDEPLARRDSARTAQTAAEAPTSPGRQRWIWAAVTLAPHRRSVLFEVVTRVVFHAMIVFALFLLFRGHNAAGGGFAAGLVVGIALAVRYLAGGRFELGEAAPIRPGVILGIGLFLSAGVGLASLALGQHAIASALVDAHLPGFGAVHLNSALIFDVGVFLVVVGLLLDVLRTLGAELDVRGEVPAP